MSAPSLPEQPTAPPSWKLTRGHLFWYDFGEATSSSGSIHLVRPCLIVGRELPSAQTVTIAPVTDIKNVTDDGTVKGRLKYPFHAEIRKPQVVLHGGPGLDVDSAAKCEQVHTVHKSEFCGEWYVGKVSPAAQAEIDPALLYALCLEPSFETLVVKHIRLAWDVRNSRYSKR